MDTILAPAKTRPTPPLEGPSEPQPRLLLSGDEAVAFGALDAGIRYASSYPGTPASEILSFLRKESDPHEIRTVWSVNEKVAYESALAVAVGGARAFVAMKHVGLNVAADAFINSCYSGVRAGLVLVVADDPGAHSSQNEQDTRHYQSLSGAILLEPGDAQEAYDMVREGYRLSERFELPVILRLTTRTAVGASPVRRKTPDQDPPAFKWVKEPDRFLMVPPVSRKRHRRLVAIQQECASNLLYGPFTDRRKADSQSFPRLGVLCTGVGAAFAAELAPKEMGLLKTAGQPFPVLAIRSFLKRHDRVLVLEEGDPILEERARDLAQGRVEIVGRLSGDLARTGELDYEQVASLFKGPRKFTETTSVKKKEPLPARLPEICKPCGYHKVFGALADMPDLATPSDIGCNTLGGLSPYNVMDTNLSMGSSIGQACGLAAMGFRRIVAILGDSTFFHAGLPPLIEAVHQGYDLTVLLLDNGTVAMTGGQEVPHQVAQSGQRAVDLVHLIEAIGVARCTPFDPHTLGKSGIRELVEETFNEPGVKVLLYRSQCGLYSPGYHTPEKFSLKRKY